MKTQLNSHGMLLLVPFVGWAFEKMTLFFLLLFLEDIQISVKLTEG